MPNMTTPFPVFDGETVEDNFRELQEWAICLTDELKYLFCNLDAGNVMEASKVKAKNIDCSKGRIKDWQMQSLTADKITAGTIDAQEITVINIDADNINTGTLNSELVNVGNSDSYGTVTLTGDSLMFYEKVKENGATKKVLRIALGRDDQNNYIFTVQNRDATQGVYMDDNGDIVISGILSTDKDCLIQGALRVGIGGNNTKGIEFYGDAYANGSACYAKIVPWVNAYDDHIKGINVADGDLWVKGNAVATEKDIANLDSEIEALKEQIKNPSK